MIYSLHGTLVEKTVDMAVVECAGVAIASPFRLLRQVRCPQWGRRAPFTPI